MIFEHEITDSGSILFALTLPLDASAFTKTALLAGHISYYFFTFAG
jgi:hypothetical protein